MDRLIYKEASGDLTCRSRDFEKIFPTLYAYEETGLTPEQAMNLGANLDAMTALAQDLSDKLDHVKKERDALAAELKDERHRHDRYVDFELAEAKELNETKKERDRLAELWAQVPAAIQEQVIRICAGEFAKDNNVPGKEEA